MPSYIFSRPQQKAHSVISCSISFVITCKLIKTILKKTLEALRRPKRDEVRNFSDKLWQVFTMTKLVSRFDNF